MYARDITIRGQNFSFFTLALSIAILFGCATTIRAHPPGVIRASTLPDLSGLAWVKDDLFISVHDAKRNPEKKYWPRVSFVRLSQSELEGVTWQSLDVEFPGPDGPSSDLESVSRIPGGRGFLFVESGQEGETARRIFFAVYTNDTLVIESQVPWPVPVENVEATEVCQVGQQLVFLYAERAEGLAATKIKWATLSLHPLEFGLFKEVIYEGIDPVGKGARPIVALAVDTDGFIYSASAYDPGNDDGPFRSVAWRIGQMIADKNGDPLVQLGEGKRLATLDGLKVESITVRESQKSGKQVFVGTDDEHYGGIIRLLPSVQEVTRP
jgi:hypothetical protein